MFPPLRLGHVFEWYPGETAAESWIIWRKHSRCSGQIQKPQNPTDKWEHDEAGRSRPQLKCRNYWFLNEEITSKPWKPGLGSVRNIFMVSFFYLEQLKFCMFHLINAEIQPPIWIQMIFDCDLDPDNGPSFALEVKMSSLFYHFNHFTVLIYHLQCPPLWTAITECGTFSQLLCKMLLRAAGVQNKLFH